MLAKYGGETPRHSRATTSSARGKAKPKLAAALRRFGARIMDTGCTRHEFWTCRGSRILEGEKTPDPNDAERVELFKSMFAWGGQFKAEGNKVTTKIEFAWQEGWKGQPGVTTAKVEGKTLTVESAPFKSTIDGSMIFTKLILERVE